MNGTHIPKKTTINVTKAHLFHVLSDAPLVTFCYNASTKDDKCNLMLPNGTLLPQKIDSQKQARAIAVRKRNTKRASRSHLSNSLDTACMQDTALFDVTNFTALDRAMNPLLPRTVSLNSLGKSRGIRRNAF